MIPRYEARFNNGVWVLFDTHAYAPVDVTRQTGKPFFETRKLLDEAVVYMNANG